MKTQPKRILAIDDQIPNTRLLKLYLEQTGNYLVREENNPLLAIAAAEEFLPDLILLDLMMPGLNGGEVATSFEAHSKLRSIPIVFLTAAITKAEAFAVGGQIGKYPFLAKPIVLAEVLQCLRKILGEGLVENRLQ